MVPIASPRVAYSQRHPPISTRSPEKQPQAPDHADRRDPHHGPRRTAPSSSPPCKHARDSASSPPTSSRSGPTCRAIRGVREAARASSTEDKSLGPGPPPQFNVSGILQDETPAPTVKGKEDHCPRCWWRKSPPDPDHWWPAMTTTQRNGIGPVRWEGQVGGAERMSCPVGWGQVNKDNIRLSGKSGSASVFIVGRQAERREGHGTTHRPHDLGRAAVL